MLHHELKLWPQFYERTEAGEKMFEIRHNDRGYQKGDTVTLKEYDPLPTLMKPLEAKGFTGREMGPYVITYVMPVDAERVVFGLKPNFTEF